MTSGNHLRSVFISDLHMGYKGADIGSLNAFLRKSQFQHLYLVGDILDGWKLEQRWYWSQDYSDFLDILMDLKRRNVRITVLTGNHDERLREPVARLYRPILMKRYGLRVEEKVIHHTTDGRRLLVIHGDQFDGRLLRGTSKHADSLWSRIADVTLNKPKAALRNSRRKQKRWSLGKAIATNAKSLIWNFTVTAIRRAEKDGVDGIICGHSHVPALQQRRGLLFANCGSWTGARSEGEAHTAIVEHLDGTLELIRQPAMRLSPQDHSNRSLDPEHPTTRTAEAARLVRLVHRLWMSPPVRQQKKMQSQWFGKTNTTAASH